MGALRESLRNSLRFAKRAPVVTTVSVIVLALGIGTCTAIFSILYAVLFSPLPYKNPDRLVVLLRVQVITQAYQGSTVSSTAPLPMVSGPDFLSYAKLGDVFSALAVGEPYGAATDSAGQKVVLRGYEVTPDFFKVLDIKPAAGRLFTADDEQAGRDHVVVLGPNFSSNGTWTSKIQVGGTLTLNKEPYSVIGRLPSSFRVANASLFWFQADPDLFIPIPIAELQKAPETNAFLTSTLTAIGRLKPGATIAQAQTEMTTIAAGLAKSNPALDAGVGVQVKSMKSQVGQVPGMLLKMLLMAVGFVLLIACINIAVLILTQGARRQHELAIRHAVGASRVRIVGQLFSESLFLAFVGGVFGVLLSFWLKEALLSRLPEASLPFTVPITISWPVLLFAVGVSFAAAVLFGVIPALQLSLVPSAELLKEAARGGSGGVRSGWLRNGFVVCEMTLAFALLIVCGLLIQGLRGMVVSITGYDPNTMLQMSVNLKPATFPSFATRENAYRQILSRVASSSLVASATLEAASMGGTVARADQPVTALQVKTGPLAAVTSVSPDYFRAMHLSLLRGRTFAWADYAEKPSVAIVNQALAQAFWANGNPLGKHVTTEFPAQPLEVVGVIQNAASQMNAMGNTPQIYLPELPAGALLKVRTVGPAKSALAAIHDLAAGAAPGVEIQAPTTMEQLETQESTPLRYLLLVLASFGLMALLLGTIGVSAVTAYSVTQRTHEICVRMALGARPAQILRDVMGEGVRLSLYGVGIGLLVALGLGKVLMHFYRGITFGSLATYFEVAALLLAVAVLACYFAARRAARVDPMNALRCE